MLTIIIIFYEKKKCLKKYIKLETRNFCKIIKPMTLLFDNNYNLIISSVPEKEEEEEKGCLIRQMGRQVNKSAKSTQNNKRAIFGFLSLLPSLNVT